MKLLKHLYRSYEQNNRFVFSSMGSEAPKQQETGEIKSEEQKQNPDQTKKEYEAKLQTTRQKVEAALKDPDPNVQRAAQIAQEKLNALEPSAEGSETATKIAKINQILDYFESIETVNTITQKIKEKEDISGINVDKFSYGSNGVTEYQASLKAIQERLDGADGLIALRAALQAPSLKSIAGTDTYEFGLQKANDSVTKVSTALETVKTKYSDTVNKEYTLATDRETRAYSRMVDGNTKTTSAEEKSLRSAELKAAQAAMKEIEKNADITGVELVYKKELTTPEETETYINANAMKKYSDKDFLAAIENNPNLTEGAADKTTLLTLRGNWEKNQTLENWKIYQDQIAIIAKKYNFINIERAAMPINNA